MKKKTMIFLFLMMILSVAYGMRVAYVNRDNGKTKIHYIADTSAVETQNFQVSKKALYDVAAFVKEFPNARICYTYQGSIYEQMDDQETLLGIRYVIYIELEIKNITDEIQPVDTANYSLFMNESHHSGLNPFLLEELNQFSGLSLKPGHSYKVLLAYDLRQDNIAPKRYRHLPEQKFSLAVTGYPNIQRIKLLDMPYVKADREALELYQSLTAVPGM